MSYSQSGSSAPSAPPAPSGYSGQQGWQQSNFSSGPPSYSSGPPSYSSAPPSYSSAPPSLAYSDSMRNQYSSQSSFSSQGGPPPSSSAYMGDPQQQYGQSQPPKSTYGQSTTPTTRPPQSPYTDASKLNSFHSQSVTGYGQQPQSLYGQPPSPSSYGQAPSAVPYGQPPQPSAYGQTTGGKTTMYGQPAGGAASYGKPAYGQTPQYSSASYPPAYPGNPYGQAFKPTPQFPPGTDPEIVRAFEMGDVDGSGLIDDNELCRVLSTGLPFSLRTVHLMLHLYSTSGSNKIGPAEFSALWMALKEWKISFERFDRDRSGRIDFNELRDGLLSMGYAIAPPLLSILISKYDRTGQGRAMDYDNFVECGMVVKGLTDRFKAKDTRYTGSATLDYETFMLMVLPFIVA